MEGLRLPTLMYAAGGFLVIEDLLIHDYNKNIDRVASIDEIGT